MGYECPVCGTPQADRRHLADHLAVTALTHGDDHETWLANTVPDWEDRSPAALGRAVADHATETEYDAVFENTVGTRGDHGHGHDNDHATGRLGDAVAGGEDRGQSDRTAESHEVVEEARELTREMLRDEGTTDEEAIGGADENPETDGGANE